MHCATGGEPARRAWDLCNRIDVQEILMKGTLYGHALLSFSFFVNLITFSSNQSFGDSMAGCKTKSRGVTVTGSGSSSL
jgi:hypothetical protein